MTDSKDFLNAVALGRVSLAKTVRSVSGSTVSFADGASADFDVVVFATGFARDVPFIHRSLRPETRGLYKARARALGTESGVLPLRPSVRVALSGG